METLCAVLDPVEEDEDGDEEEDAEEGRERTGDS